MKQQAYIGDQASDASAVTTDVLHAGALICGRCHREIGDSEPRYRWGNPADFSELAHVNCSPERTAQ